MPAKDTVTPYIKKQLKAGFSESDIRNELFKAGYTQAEITAGFGKAKGIPAPARAATAPVPAPSSSGTPMSPWGVPYAGFWIRFAAMLIDGLLVAAIFVPLFILSIFINPILAVVAYFAMFGFQIFYEIYFTGKYGATYGKKWLGIKVVNENGEVIGYGGATIRWLGRIVVSFTIGIGYIIIGFTEKKQGIHDMIAKTYVIEQKTEF